MNPSNPIESVYAGERANAATTAETDDPERARRHVMRQQDGLVAHVQRTAPGRVACRDGCAFCCYLRVVASPVEVFGLANYLSRELSEQEFAQLKDRTAARAAQVSGMTHEQQIHTNMACPLLVNNRCIGYAARPLRCRNYHSLDRASCEDMFARPESDDPSPMDGELKMFGDALVQGFEHGLADAGFDARPYELSTALHEAMTDPQAQQRFRRRQHSFLTAQAGNPEEP